MVLTLGRCASLTSLLLVLSAMRTLVRSQAPKDADGQSCKKAAVPDGVVRLLDLGWYATLLSGGSNAAGWTQTPDNSWSGEGNHCVRRLVSDCDVSNAWVATQYINKTAVVNYTMQIVVELEGDSSTSSTSTVKVHYYPSNAPIASNAQLDPSNYHLAGSLTYTPTASEKTVTFSLGSQFDRFYIAIEADNACFILRGLKVSYEVCRSDPVGLVVYPDTPIGNNDETVSAKCKDNAIVSPGSSLSVICNMDGTYSGSPSCSCGGGHYELGEMCYACAANFFARPGDGTCTECPTNTHSSQGASECDCNTNFYKASFNTCPPCPANSTSPAGSDECTCVTDYYRTYGEDSSKPCTTAPTKPASLTNSSRTDKSVTLSWVAPTFDGGRPNDLFYTIQYKNLGGDSFDDYSTPSPIKGTMVTVIGLDPVTTYVFRVVAQNNVTVEFPNAFQTPDRTSNEATVTTTPSPPVIQGCSVEGANTLVWRLSTESLSDVTGYEINITGSDPELDTNVFIMREGLPANKLYYFPILDDFSTFESQGINLTVRGVNSGGVGPWCDKGASISSCAYQHLINPPENCDIIVDTCPTLNPVTCPTSCPTSSMGASSVSQAISLEGYVLYTVAGVVVALYAVLIAILVILCCCLKFRKKDYYITQTKSIFDTEMVKSEKV